MVQWFCFISWILFDGETSYLHYQFHLTQWLISQHIKISVTYISWFSDYALYIEYYLMEKCHTWIISSMWPNGWHENMSRSVWPTFHGYVILPYNSKTSWWRNDIPWIYLSSMWLDDWPQNISRSVPPIFHDSVILTYILNTIWWRNVRPRNISSMWPNDWHKNISRSVCLLYISWSSDFAL